MTPKIDKKIHFIAFIVGMGLYIHFRPGVRISLTEVLLPGLLFYLSGSLRSVIERPEFRIMFVTAIMSVIAISVSDFINEVPTVSYLKSVAFPLAMTAYRILFLILFLRQKTTIVSAMLGILTGTALHYFFNTADDQFDFGRDSGYTFFVFRVTPLLVAGLSILFFLLARKFWYAPSIIAAVLAVLSLPYLARSTSLVFLAFSILLFLVAAKRPNLSLVFSPLKRLPGFFVLGFIGITSFLFLYAFLAENGYLGSRAAEKYAAQEKGLGVLSLVLHGRADSIASVFMIVDAPFIGHGSTSARVHYFQRAARLAGSQELERHYYKSGGDDANSWGHSMLLSNWANAGMLVLPMWIYSILLVLRLIVVQIGGRDEYFYLVGLFSVSFLWEVLFSPASVQSRAIVPMLESFSIVAVPAIQQYYMRQRNSLPKVRLVEIK